MYLCILWMHSSRRDVSEWHMSQGGTCQSEWPDALIRQDCWSLRIDSTTKHEPAKPNNNIRIL